MDDDEENGSLFGSPPSTPGRGKSPELALPSGPSSGPAQNVGTIALPGSQHCSELPMNPLALSSRLAFHEIASPRPPAVFTTPQISSTPTPTTSRPSSALSSARPKKSTQRTKSQKSQKAATPRPEPPPIVLPDGPLPPNFLRSQSALLGTAGLVAGIHPSHLGMPRGSSSRNPIVVEDREITRPKLSRRRTQPPVSDALLSVPSHQEVVRILVGQKDIFPVLKGILKLATEDPQLFSGLEVRSAPTDVTNSLQNDQASQPSKKRRKLDHVPAGAADWDVPFPFEEGYGPQSYRRDWKRERAKQLASELMSLIKDAIRKAATKSYWKQQRLEGLTVNPPQGDPSSVRHGSNSTGSSREATPSVFSSSPTPATPTTQVQEHGLDQLVSSLLSAVPGQNALPHHDASLHLGPQGDPDPFAHIFHDLDTAQSDQSMLDTWMSILNTFPATQDGFPTPDHPPLLEPFLGDDLTMPVDGTPSSASAPAFHEDLLHYDYNNSPNFEHTPASIFQHPISQHPISQHPISQNQQSSSHSEIAFDPMQIDSFPLPSPSVHFSANSTALPALGSASVSSGFSTSSTLMDIDENIDPELYQLKTIDTVEDTDPGTMIGPNLKLSLPIGFGEPQASPFQGDSMLQPALSPGPSAASSALYTPTSATQELGPFPEIYSHSSRSSQEPDTRAPGDNPWEVSSYTNGEASQKQQSTNSRTVQPLTTLPPKPRKSSKQAARATSGPETARILERARARRMQLRVQLEDAQVKLWEVMMEGNALNYLLQHS